MLFTLVLLAFGRSLSRKSSNQVANQEFYEQAYNRILEVDDEIENKYESLLARLSDQVSRKQTIPKEKAEEFVKFLELRNEKKRVKKLFKKLLKKKGLAKFTGKKVTQLSKSCKTCKSRCIKAQKMVRAQPR